MRRWLPQGITGQIALLTVAALVSAHVTAFAVFLVLARSDGLEGPVLTGLGLAPPLAQPLAGPVDIVIPNGPFQIRGFAPPAPGPLAGPQGGSAVLPGGPGGVFLPPSPISAVEQLATVMKLMEAVRAPADRARLLHAARATLPHLAIEPAEARRDAVPAAGGAGTLGLLGTLMAPGPVVLRSEAGEADQVFVRTSDGAVFKARVPRLPEPRAWPISPTLAGTIAFLGASLAFFAVWAARALTSPLSRFAHAAERFGRDLDPTPIDERGPDEIRRAARAFNAMRGRIARMVDERTRMLAALSHDLRTPITRLRLRTEFVTDTALRGPMLRDLDQMSALVGSALSFLTEGRRRPAMVALDLASLLRAVCDDATDGGGRVDYEGPDHRAVTGDPDGLRRALDNLVDNALRYGTAVTVALREAGAGRLAVEVADDGPGIPEADKARVLEPFERGDVARGGGGTGFGLGLAIARAVAQAHGGDLTLHDRAGGGCVARLTLAVLPEGHNEQAPPERG